MDPPERHRQRPTLMLLVLLAWTAVLIPKLCGALNCALPEPQLVGVQNATAVELPVDIVLTTISHHQNTAESNDLVFVATRNTRNMPWGRTITIKTPGRHRILATVSALRSACSRTDFFIFDGYLPSESKENIQAESTELQCLTTPELHLLVFWSAMPDDQFSGLHRVVAALSDVVSYPGADYHVRLHGVFRADPGAEKIDESWYQAFYGDTYYGLYFGTSDKVDMLHVKGDGAFHVALVEDMCPKYAYDLERGMVLNTNMFALKNMLRELSPQWYQVHATQTLQESNTNYKFLFGGTAREIFRSLQLDKRWSAAEYSEARVDNGAYVLAWRRVFISVDAMETLGAMMQSEWYRLELDVPEIHAELTPGMLDPDPTSSQENILRAAFLGSSRLPLLAHLPTDTRWNKGMLELKHVKAFRVLKDNSWGLQLPPCISVGAAAAILSSADLATPEDTSLRNHVRQLQHRLDHFNHTIIVVGASVDGPFTIWDGNHRAIALAIAQPDSHLLLVYVGISARFASPHRGSLCCPK